MPKSLTSEAFAKLLSAFSDDEAAAAAAYGELRGGLLRFFQLRGISDFQQAADETLDRLPERIGEQTKKEEIRYIAFGIAKFVLLEKLREERREISAADGFYPPDGAPEPFGAADEFEPLRECFQKLYAHERRLLSSYFTDLPAAELAAHRARLAEREGIDLNSLRNRISRLRRRLEDCLDEKK